MPHPDTWLTVRPQGLWCEPGRFFIDPVEPVERAIVTHAHADHARPGHGAVLASAGTLAIMDVRMGEGRSGRAQQALGYGERLRLGDVDVWLQPAGHVLGSAQVAMEYRGSRAVVSGDYKRVPDPTCLPFEPIPCDVFVTEATFGLPVFRHPDPAGEVRRLLDSVALFPDRTHVVGCYALGKCQRLISLIRAAGWDRPLFLHGALLPVCRAYEAMGVPLGDLRPATASNKAELAGAIVLAPPSAIADRWARRLADPVVCLASGWMRVRQRAKAKGVELPLVISDHCDWDELCRTLVDVDAPEVWVTHGREEALIHQAELQGRIGRPLRLIGYGDEEESEDASAADTVTPDLSPARSPSSGRPVSGSSTIELSKADLSGDDPSGSDRFGAELPGTKLPDADPSEAGRIKTSRIAVDQSAADPSRTDVSDADPALAELLEAGRSDADLPDADPSNAGPSETGSSGPGLPTTAGSGTRHSRSGPVRPGAAEPDGDKPGRPA